MSPDVAERFGAVPLLRVGKRIVVASIAPLEPRPLAIVADELGIEPELIILAIAPELRIRYVLELVYNIPRPQRFLRTPASSNATYPRMPRVLELVEPITDEPSSSRLAASAIKLDAPIELSDLGPVTATPSPHSMSEERRRYLETLADLLVADEDDDAALARLEQRTGSAPRRLVTGDVAQIELIDPAQLTAALDAIEYAADRNELIRLALDAVARFEPAAQSATVLTVRDTTAVSWACFSRDGAPLPPAAVRLDQPGLVPAVMTRKAMVRCSSGDLGASDYLLLASLGVAHGDLVVAPIALGEHVVGMLAVTTPRGSEVLSVEAIASAVGKGLARLMREARR